MDVVRPFLMATCPDCGQLVNIPYMVLSIEDEGRQFTARLDEDAFDIEMSEHVMADPEAHPSFTVSA